MESMIYDGTWAPVIEFLDKCAGGRMRIPLGYRPPVEKVGDDLVVHNRQGTFTCEPGDTLAFGSSSGEFFAIKKER